MSMCRRSALIGLVGLLLSVEAWSASYVAFEQITVAAASIALTGTKITPTGLPMATYASCRLETAQIRWTIDGTVPTTTVGTPLEPGDILELTGHDLLAQFRSIRTTATSGTLNCVYVAP